MRIPTQYEKCLWVWVFNLVWWCLVVILFYVIKNNPYFDSVIIKCNNNYKIPTSPSACKFESNIHFKLLSVSRTWTNVLSSFSARLIYGFLVSSKGRFLTLYWIVALITEYHPYIMCWLNCTWWMSRKTKSNNFTSEAEF